MARKNRKLVVLIDGNFFAFRAYATRSLSTSTGIQTSVISGMLQMFKNLYKRFQYDRLIICWDSTKGSALRKGLFPEYKANRKEAKEERKDLFVQMRQARKFFKTLNVRQAVLKGVEGDDMMGILSAYYAKEQEVLIVSADKDLLQLVRPSVSVFRPINDQMVDTREFADMYDGITPNQFIKAKSLMGDKGDNIPGVPGIGEKRAIEIVKRYPTLKDVLDDTSAKPYIRAVGKHIKTVNLAFKLVKICRKPSELGNGFKKPFSRLVASFKGKRIVEVNVMVTLIRSLEMRHRNWDALADALTIRLDR